MALIRKNALLSVLITFSLWVPSMKFSDAKEHRILVLPSGGATGIIPATLLAKIEQETGKRVYELFDEIWGSSIGAITAALLTLPKESEDAPSHSTSSAPPREPRSALEVVEFIEDTFSGYLSAARIRGRFRRLIEPSTLLQDTLIPIRILSAEVTEWRMGLMPKKTKKRAFCRDQEGNLSLSSIACGSCTVPPFHRTEPLEMPNGEYAYCIDAGHEFCGASACMDPTFVFIEQYSQSIDLSKDSISIFFLSNGWVNLDPSWGTQGKVWMRGHAGPVPVNLFNVAADLTPAIQEWKRDTWTGWTLAGVQNSSSFLLNLVGIGAVPTGMMKRIAEDIAQSSPVFQSMIEALKSER